MAVSIYRFSARAAILLTILGMQAAFAQNVSTNKITLTASPNPAKVKEKITLKAQVTTNNQPALGGTVTFFSGKLPLGSVQVVGANPAPGFHTGDAVLTTILVPKTHNLTAVYGGTADSPDVVRSKHVQLEVTGKTASNTSLVARPNEQNPQNYDMIATVRGFGFKTPRNSAAFRDTTAGVNLGSAPMDASTTKHGFTKPKIATVTGGGPAESVIADFNADGFPDIATANADFGPGTMAVLLGKGNGQVGTPVTYPTGVFTSGIVTGDFNQDGIPDIAAMSQGSTGTDGDVAVFLGKGDGSFQDSIDDVLGSFPVAIALGDFNRDGILDFVTIDYFTAFANVSLGNGDGTFQATLGYPVGGGPFSVATADLDDDGFVDIVVVNGDVDTMSVLIGNGDGTFQQQQVYQTGRQVEFVAVGDFNKDGFPDIAVANFAEPSVGIFINKGDGTFKDQVAYPVNGNDSGLGIADIDGDGNLDIAASYFHPSKVGVLRGKGNGTFKTVLDFNTGQTQGFQLSVGDLDGDGSPEIISDDIQNSISVLRSITQAKAILKDVAVPGNQNDIEKIVASYPGDAHYRKSKSKPVEVHGSGGR
jgi:hypothetical protein